MHKKGLIICYKRITSANTTSIYSNAFKKSIRKKQ